MRHLPRFIKFHRLPLLSSGQWRCGYRLNCHLSYDENIPILDYEPIKGVEGLERYRPGGYCPIVIGDIIKGRYQIVHRLGRGKLFYCMACTRQAAEKLCRRQSQYRGLAFSRG
jgi:hypothetical protein